MLGWTGGVAFAHLHVADSTAGGKFLSDNVYFMPARPHAAPSLDAIQLGVGDRSETKTDPSLLKNDTALFVAQLAAPQAQHAWAGDILTLDDTETGSHADVRPAPGDGWVVHQNGPIRIWDAVEKAIATWREADSPHQSGFGLTVTPESQRVWLGQPDGPSWELPRSLSA
ncbi:hypothetical protein [Nonomuraea sp. NPDC048826]|uniref:hypothetical protein n=1 Tax=Nonomuraea sp. NPDC048826 TaxID=3364347 RepID=UPI003718C7DF